MNYYPVAYDTTYLTHGDGLYPLADITPLQDSARAAVITDEFLGQHWKKMVRQPIGNLKRPYVVPGVYEALWDWDSFFIACAMPEESLPYGQGSILNLLDGVRADGRPPKMASPSGAYLYDAHPYPLHAQFCYLIAERMGDFDWVDAVWEKLLKVGDWYERETVVRGGYHVWLGLHGNGIDNNPAVYGRPPKSSAGVDLACWHYRDLRAMAALANKLNKPGAAEFGHRAETLGQLVRSRYWDQMDGFFYNIDCLTDQRETALQEVTWETFLKFRNWASFFPLWARLATPDQATALRNRMMDATEFLAPAGLRSHSARDPIYHNTATGNPSNWQGPVWGLSTFLTAYCLNHYGYREDAVELASRLLKVFAADIETNVCLHEFYHGDTSQPLINPGFLSWNLLALGVMNNLQENLDPTTGALLDENAKSKI
jgi:putative isomerase